MFQPKVVEKIQTHILCSITIFLKTAIYEIIWKNVMELADPRCQYGACPLISCNFKATGTVQWCRTLHS